MPTGEWTWFHMAIGMRGSDVVIVKIHLEQLKYP